MMLLRLATQTSTLGVASQAAVPLANLGQLELGIQGVEHGVPFLLGCGAGGIGGQGEPHSSARARDGERKRQGRTVADGEQGSVASGDGAGTGEELDDGVRVGLHAGVHVDLRCDLHREPPFAVVWRQCGGPRGCRSSEFPRGEAAATGG